MTFIDALRESINGNSVVSCEGNVYASDYINAKSIGKLAFVSDSVVSTAEIKGDWEINLIAG